MPDVSAPRTARARARADLTREIKAAARRQLAEHGAAGLSLRAVSRELGMVSSAIYRYFPTRDELLTALIVDAYSALADHAEKADAGVPDRQDGAARWTAGTRAVRGWALEHRHEWALIFGSPVPGYAAPQTTVDPAARVPLLFVQIARECPPAEQPASSPLPPPVDADMRALAQLLATELSPSALAALVGAWSRLVGTVNFELFGHLVGAVSDYAAWFDQQMATAAAPLGLAPS